MSAALLHRIASWCTRSARDRCGNDLVEYALLAGLVGIAGAAALTAFPDIMHDAYASWDAATQAIWEPPDP